MSAAECVVSTQWLADHLGEVVVVEVAFMPPSKAEYFSAGHIPGSHYRYWKDFCWHSAERSFADPVTMAARLAELGVDDQTTLVLVGDRLQFATYAYWTLAMAGLEQNARVLDGARATWTLEGRPLTLDMTPPPVAGHVTVGSARSAERIGRDEVLAGIDSGARTLVDLRSPEEYRGERVAPLTAEFDHGAERAGHIPGAVSLPHEELLAADGTFLGEGEIAARFAAVGAGAGSEVVAYCRLSHRASLAWFVLTQIGDRSNVGVYDGSWTEWGSMVGMPIELSEE